MDKLQTVIETPEFQRRAKDIMSDTEREAAILWIAQNPESGVALAVASERFASRVKGRGKAGVSHAICIRRTAYADLSDHRVCQK